MSAPHLIVPVKVPVMIYTQETVYLGATEADRVSRWEWRAVMAGQTFNGHTEPTGGFHTEKACLENARAQIRAWSYRQMDYARAVAKVENVEVQS